MCSMPDGAAITSSTTTRRVSDRNGDGVSDILWRNSDGALHAWIMNAAGGYVDTAIGSGPVGNEWHVIV